MRDVLSWASILQKQIQFLEDAQKRIKTEHKYYIRYIRVLLDKEWNIISKYHLGQEDYFSGIHRELYAIIESWRVDFINSLKIKEITSPNDPNLAYFYHDVMEVSFSHNEELSYFQQSLVNFSSNKARFHILVIKSAKGKVIAGECFYFFCVSANGHAITFGVGDYLAVLPDYRRYSLGTTLVATQLKILNQDAKNIGLRHVQSVLGEYNNLPDSTGFDPVDRKRFWHQMHMRKVDYPHPSPGWCKDMREIDRNWTLGFWSLRKRKKVSSKYLLHLLNAFYIQYYGVSKGHNIIRHVEAILKKHKSVDIVSLV